MHFPYYHTFPIQLVVLQLFHDYVLWFSYGAFGAAAPATSRTSISLLKALGCVVVEGEWPLRVCDVICCICTPTERLRPWLGHCIALTYILHILY